MLSFFATCYFEQVVTRRQLHSFTFHQILLKRAPICSKHNILFTAYMYHVGVRRKKSTQTAASRSRPCWLIGGKWDCKSSLPPLCYPYMMESIHTDLYDICHSPTFSVVGPIMSHRGQTHSASFFLFEYAWLGLICWQTLLYFLRNLPLWMLLT